MKKLEIQSRLQMIYIKFDVSLEVHQRVCQAKSSTQDETISEAALIEIDEKKRKYVTFHLV